MTTPGYCAACHHPIRKHARPCRPRRVPIACPEQLAGRTCQGGICKTLGCSCFAAVEHLPPAAPAPAKTTGRSRRGPLS